MPPRLVLLTCLPSTIFRVILLQILAPPEKAEKHACSSVKALGKRVAPVSSTPSEFLHRALALLTEILMGIFIDVVHPLASTDLPLDRLDDDLEHNLHHVSFFNRN
jgi:hypothetical protein